MRQSNIELRVQTARESEFLFRGTNELDYFMRRRPCPIGTYAGCFRSGTDPVTCTSLDLPEALFYTTYRIENPHRWRAIPSGMERRQLLLLIRTWPYSDQLRPGDDPQEIEITGLIRDEDIIEIRTLDQLRQYLPILSSDDLDSWEEYFVKFESGRC